MRVTSYGLFWRESEIDWYPGTGARDSFRLLGRVGSNRRTIKVADFRHQQGIYILYDEYGPSYVGLTRDQGLGKRLKDHKKDHLKNQWDRFSWFGFRPVTEEKSAVGICLLGDPEEDISENTKTTIGDLEALLIQAIGPKKNRRKMKFDGARMWTQVEYDHMEILLGENSRSHRIAPWSFGSEATADGSEDDTIEGGEGQDMAVSIDPEVPEFAHYDDYGRFARRVRMENRFATDPGSRAFLAAVLATASPRARRIKGGSLLYRAQLGIEEHERTEEDGETYLDVLGHGRDRMVPKAEIVGGGRANAAGIAFLYLASKEITAISEVRPWIGASVSVAQFRVGRDLRVLDLSAGHGEFGFGKLTFDQLEGKEPISPEKMREVVWTDIDAAFSRPVSRGDDGAEYAPTQVLAEAFRGAGYDAIAYRSNFGDPGHNVVLFDVGDAEILNCTPFDVRGIKVDYRQSGNTWYRAEPEDG